MPFQRLGDLDPNSRTRCSQPFHKAGQVAFQMEPEGEEVRDDDHPPDPFVRQAGDRPRQIGLAQFEEGSLNMHKRTHAGEFGGYRPDSVISTFDPRAVGKYDNASHTGGTSAAPKAHSQKRTHRPFRAASLRTRHQYTARNLWAMRLNWR